MATIKNKKDLLKLLKVAFEAGREFEGHCDKTGCVVGLTKEAWLQYLKYISFNNWIKNYKL